MTILEPAKTRFSKGRSGFGYFLIVKKQSCQLLIIRYRCQFRDLTTTPITNPELVKTGLDLPDFPTIAFLQTGYNVYSLQQAAKRSWRIGQKDTVRVVFFGYIGTAHIQRQRLMAQKIAVSQSTSGEMPESGLEILNQEDDSIEMTLARRLM